MRRGIAIVGLNGSGKSTLGHALARELGWFEIDSEDYYFPEQRESRRAALEGVFDGGREQFGAVPYSAPRGGEEVNRAVAREIAAHPEFILSSVTLNWSEEILAAIRTVFWLKAETDERVRRVKRREERRWGARVAEGGDMYEQQLAFRAFIAARTEAKVEESVRKAGCDVVELDGMLPIARNVDIIKSHLKAE